MVGVYGSSLPLGSACFHAPLAKRAGAFVVGGEVKTCKGLIIYGVNIWCVNNKPYIYSSHATLSPDSLIFYMPLTQTPYGHQFNLYNNKKQDTQFILCHIICRQ